MRHHITLLLLPAIVFWIGCERYVPLEPGSPPDEAAVPWGEAVKGLRTRLVPLQSRFYVGESMLFRLELRNDGPTTVTYWPVADELSCLEVKDPGGKRMPNVGDRIRQTCEFAKQIAPGETVVLLDSIDASWLYFFEKPGRFEVRFHGGAISVEPGSLAPEYNPSSGKGRDTPRYELDWWLTIPSNTLSIRVLPGRPLPPAYIAAGRIGLEAPKSWWVMLDEAGGDGDPGKISLYSGGNWINVRLSEAPMPPPGPAWENWGESHFGFVSVSIPIRAEGRWPEMRSTFQRVLKTSRPVLRREGEDGLLVDLYVAVRQKDAAGLFEMVKANPELARRRFELDSNLKMGREETLLHMAADLGSKELATLVLDLGAEIDALTRSGETALFFAVNRSDLDMARHLISRGADVDRTGRARRTPLGRAAAGAKVEMVRFLVEAGAEVNGVSYGNPCETPLGDAIMGGDPDVVRLLLEKGAKPDLRHNDFWSPLHCAARDGHMEIARLLLARGADVNDGAEKTRQTPLHLACMEGRLEMARLLADNGADPNPLDRNRNTPLDFVDAKAHPELAAFLVSRGARCGKR